jgi:hypothetical protein
MNRTLHPEIVDLSAQRYVDYLGRLIGRPTLSSAAQGAIRALQQSLAAGLELRESLGPADIPFTANLLRDVDDETLTRLVNQWTLGWGSDDAKVLVMGTEEAYALGPSLAFWNCCCSILWLCGSNPQVLQRIDPSYLMKGVQPRESVARRAYHIFSTDYEIVAENRTWGLLAAILARGTETRRQLLKPGNGDLGLRAYQVEVSAHPSTVTERGVTPTPPRHEFLESLVESMSSSAKVLVFHGKPGNPEWGRRDELARQFLGMEPAADLGLVTVRVGRQWFKHTAPGDKTVLFVWSLSRRNRLTDDYLSTVGDVVEGSIKR